MSRVLAACCLAVLIFGCGEEILVERDPDPPHTDVFEQVRASSIDILFVIDNSDSMQEERAALASNFATFLAYIDPDPTRSGEAGEVDYRIAITTTDAIRTDGALVGDPPVIQPGASYNPLEKFQAALASIRRGGAYEEGFEAALLALERAKGLRDSQNRPAFMRDGAYLYVIVVTDEDDASFGEVRYFHRRFETLKGIGNENMVAFSAIAGPLPDGCGEAEAGVRYAALANLTGGVLGDICTEDWGSTLRQLAVRGIGLRKRFQLTYPPRDQASPEGIGPEDFQDVQIHYPCDYPDDDPHLSEAACAQVARACNDDPRAVICVPWWGETDGWVFEPRDNTIVFDGAAVPGPRSRIQLRYRPRDL